MRVREVLFGVLGAAVWVPVVHGADKEPPVQVEVWAIRATMRDEKVSDELKDIAKVLRKQFKFTGFTAARKTGKRVELGKALEAPLIDDYQAAVKPLKRTGETIELELVVTKKPSDDERKKNPTVKPKVVLKTTVKINAGPLLPVGGLPLENGDALIVAIRAR